MKKMFFLLFCIICNIGLFPQHRYPKIEGYVFSEDKPLEGANVFLKGTTTGTITNKEGYYQLTKLPRGNFIIRASYMGYRSQEAPVKLRGHHLVKINFDLQEDLIETENIVVTANRQEINRKDAPTIVNILDSKTFESTNSLNLADGLSYQPGLRLETNCQNCGFQQVRINGLEGPYSQILIDSKPIFSALNSVYGIEQIPVNMIERVEIVRGGGSALYGSNVIGGVINVLTKVPASNFFQVGTNLFWIDSKIPGQVTSLNASLINDDCTSGIVLFGSFQSRSKYDANNDGFSEIGKIDDHALGFKSFYKTSAANKIKLEYHTLREFRRGGNKFDLQPHETDITEQVQHLINSGSIDYSYISSRTNFNTYLSLQQIDRKSYYGAKQDPNAYGSTTDFTFASGIQYGYNFEHLIFSPAVLMSGIEYQLNNLDDKMPGYDRKINQKVQIAGFYLQGEWNFDKLKYSIGARLDKHNLIKKAILSPRTTLLYRFVDEIQARFSYSKGYRAPQAFDEDLHVTAVGGEVILIKLAEDLSPENSYTFSTSLDLYPKLGKMQTNLLFEAFYTKLRDVFVLNEVGTDLHGNKIIERQNGSGAEVYGLNFEARFVPTKQIDLQLGLTLQKSLYTQPQRWSDDSAVPPTRQMHRTPDRYAYFTLIIEPTLNFNISISGIYTGSMYVPHYTGYILNDVLEKSDDFFEWNVKLAHSFVLSNTITIQLNGGIQNILNSYQKDFDKGIFRDAGYIYGPSRPRTLFLGIKISS
jgi:outer membrane receptor for ferrienterochelin and colicins